MNTDRIAALYRWIEYAAFGRALERRRFAFLPLVKGAQRVLIAGEGDGRFLARLVRQNPDVRVDVLESSVEMIRLARSRLPPGANVTFHREDALETPPEGPFDLVVTHFFLDCLSDEETVRFIEGIKQQLSFSAFWLVSDFQQVSFWPANWHSWLWLRVMYAFFRLSTGLRTAKLPQIDRALHGAGFELVTKEEARLGLIVSQLWRLDQKGSQL
ncbi:class I SAM-dependent methyltransferase [uncultured Paludibaculum sp.]|uniref:class I SAM-dependent methyltransferase n=1 Tax=uncultured Paludibaculum sp. TaxID=1765020 RepID=UPI002AAAA314|nr:class I SAM-dependent methyltransferase [uncultured Paludibaculum sp.]